MNEKASASDDSLENWAQRISARLGRAPRALGANERALWHLPFPGFVDATSDAPDFFVDIVTHQHDVAEKGELVMAKAMWPSEAVWDPDEELTIAPAGVLYSHDVEVLRQFRVPWEFGRKMAALAESGEEPDDDVATLVHWLQDNDGRPTLDVFKNDDTAGFELVHTSVLLTKRHLPDGVLPSHAWIPLVVHPDRRGHALVVPREYW